MSLAAETRAVAAEHPFLVDALRAGVCNYTAAARFLDVDGDPEAVATALRRYADDLRPYEADDRDARVTMESGVGPVDDPADAVLAVGGTTLGPTGGDRTAILATGEVDVTALSAVLNRLAVTDVDVVAAGVGTGAADAPEGAADLAEGTADGKEGATDATAGTAVVVVNRRDGAGALRAVEGALDDVPR